MQQTALTQLIENVSMQMDNNKDGYITYNQLIVVCQLLSADETKQLMDAHITGQFYANGKHPSTDEAFAYYQRVYKKEGETKAKQQPTTVTTPTE